MLFVIELIAVSILLGFFTFAIRLPFLIVPCGDNAITWWIINRHRNSNKIEYAVPDSIVPGVLGYPPLQYFVVSRFPQKYWAAIANFSNLAYDSFAVVIAYLCTTLFFVSLEQEQPQILALWVAVLYATAPLLLPVTARLNGIKAQSLGSLISLVYFVSLGAAYVYGFHVFYLVAAFCVILSILSSAFSIQNIAFVSVLLSVFYVDWIPVSVFIGGVLLGLAIPPLGILKVLKFKLNHTLFLHRNRAGMVYGLDKAHRISDLFTLPFLLFRRPDQFMHLALNKNSYASVILNLPIFLLLCYWLVSRQDLAGFFLENGATRYSLMVVLAGFVLFLVTSQQPLVSMGPGDRYLGEYSFPFIAFLAVVAMAHYGNSPITMLYVLMMQLSMVALAFTYLVRGDVARELKKPFSDKDDEKIAEHIQNFEEPQKILVVPLKSSFVLSAKVDRPSIKFYHQWVSNGDSGFAYQQQDSESYNWPRREFAYFWEKYGVDTVVVRRNSLTKEKLEQLIAANDWPKTYENEEYTVYRKQQAVGNS